MAFASFWLTFGYFFRVEARVWGFWGWGDWETRGLGDEGTGGWGEREIGRWGDGGMGFLVLNLIFELVLALEKVLHSVYIPLTPFKGGTLSMGYWIV